MFVRVRSNCIVNTARIRDITTDRNDSPNPWVYLGKDDIVEVEPKYIAGLIDALTVENGRMQDESSVRSHYHNYLSKVDTLD